MPPPLEASAGPDEVLRARAADADDPWNEAFSDVARRLGSDPATGLSAEEAAARIARDGPNEIDETSRTPAWLAFLRQFTDTMILVLIGAAIVTVVVGDLKDMVVILAVITLNATIGYSQERRADHAMAALRRMSSPTAHVTRDGRMRAIAANEVSVGDLLHLEPGDVIAADARLVEAPGLRVNEAALTGESVPVEKETDPMVASAPLVSDRRNMVFKGTAVVAGRGIGIVTATGMRTELGTIARLLQAHRAPQTPLQRRLAVFGRRIAFVTVAICAVVFVLGVVDGVSPTRMLITAVSLAVAAIPESLPAVVTISLALGAQRMARQHAIVRRLPAVETLGSVTVIATDKTGTLTEGRMFAGEIWLPDRMIIVDGNGYEPVGTFRVGGRTIDPETDALLNQLLRSAALANDATLAPPVRPGDDWSIVGDPTEGALLALAAKAGIERSDLQERYPRIAELAFDATRKRMSTIHARSGGVYVAVKGAPESLRDAATHIATAAGSRTLEGSDRLTIQQAVQQMADRGYRVLAIAGATHDSVPPIPEIEQHLTLYGLVGLADPPRAEAAAAVETAVAAGIRPVMVTGDHPATARAIATHIGILDGGSVVTGAELAAWSSEHLARRVSDIAVYARTTPEQKLNIVEAWKARGEIVAMTGDGVNDAPALKRADIGVAMGAAGTEVSKEASDMVLADDNFSTIVSAVREGRRIYDNIRRFVRYGLTGGAAEILVMVAAPLLGLPLALLPAQILWINLMTHGLPGLALGVEPAERGVMNRPPRAPSESIFARGLWQHVCALSVLTAAICLSLGFWGYRSGRPWQTMIFTSLALLQLGNALAVRSEYDSFFTLRLATNRFLIWTVVGSVALQIALPFIPPLAHALSLRSLSAGEISIVLAASTGSFWAIELEKAIRRRARAGVAIA